MADIRQTRFYQEVFAEDREEGRELGAQQGEAAAVIRLLTRRLESLPEAQVAHIRELPLPQLEALLDVVLDLADGAELANWLAAHPVTTSEPTQ
nr:DUF4351 domain-containing protein [Petrachloros mirabilis]